jgi:hypothetical protein
MDYVECKIPKEFCNVRKNGKCTLNIQCQKIIEQCEGCDRVENGYCKAYINPTSKWVDGKICPMATHVEQSSKKDKKVRVGQQKQSKKRKK